MFSYKNFTYIFILLIFSNTSQGQVNSEKYICIEKNLFQISMEAKKYYNELNNSYSINVTPSHLVFLDGSLSNKNYIKFPIKSKNGQYFKIYQDNINLHIQFGPSQNIEMPFYLKYSRNDISFSEMSYSECKILK